MAKVTILVDISCSGCNTVFGTFAKSDVPKKFICTKCGLGQQSVLPTGVGYSHKRNYPSGYFENS